MVQIILFTMRLYLMTDRPYTIKTAAAYLDCSEQNVRNLCQGGHLKSFRLGGGSGGPYRILVAAMKEYERQCTLSGLEDTGTPMSESTERPAARPWVPKIVTKPSDGSPTSRPRSSGPRRRWHR